MNDQNVSQTVLIDKLSTSEVIEILSVFNPILKLDDFSTLETDELESLECGDIPVRSRWMFEPTNATSHRGVVKWKGLQFDWEVINELVNEFNTHNAIHLVSYDTFVDEETKNEKINRHRNVLYSTAKIFVLIEALRAHDLKYTYERLSMTTAEKYEDELKNTVYHQDRHHMTGSMTQFVEQILHKFDVVDRKVAEFIVEKYQ